MPALLNLRPSETAFQAPCVGREALFFPAGEGNPEDKSMAALAAAVEAKAICYGCPDTQKAACLTVGLKPENLSYGVWGGLDVRERKAIAASRNGV